MLQICPFHTDEDVHGTPLGDDIGTLSFECTRKGHPHGGAFSWPWVPEPPGGGGMSGLAAELALALELPAIVGFFAGRWIEYGVVEQAYAVRNPGDFARLVEQYGHRAVSPAAYTASSFLAHALSPLAKSGVLAYRFAPATGYWSYNSKISWWAAPPAPDWGSRLSWADADISMAYVPGAHPPL